MTTVRNNHLNESITWEETTNPEYPYSAKIGQDNYVIRLNDFPDESLYTLIVNNEEVEDFDDWPEQWIRTGDAPRQKVEQTEKVRRRISHKSKQVSVARQKDRRANESELSEIVRRIIAKDPDAEEEMVRRYRDGVSQIIYQVVRNQSVTEDLAQESLIKALEKIRNGDVREPERLSGYICAIARFMALDHIRKMRSAMKLEEEGVADQIPDPSPDPYEQVLNKEKAEIVRKVISEMKVQRDRDVLFRHYILEEEKDKICADLGLTSQQLESILYRAISRNKKLFLALRNQNR
jgi:RNA polymerase sigma-70 factor, ECF subfamily